MLGKIAGWSSWMDESTDFIVVLSISIGQHYIPCRLEMDDDWYILLPGARFDLRHKETYKVEI